MNTTLPIQAITTGIQCPRCQSSHASKNGAKKTVHQYRCRKCNKSFSSTTGTSIHGIHKRKQFEQYIECLQAGMTIRQAAKHIGIAISTSFAWRHKHLSAQRGRSKQSNLPLVSIGILATPYSRKGAKTSIRLGKPFRADKTALFLDANGILNLKTFETIKDLVREMRSNASINAVFVTERNSLLTRIKKRLPENNLSYSRSLVQFFSEKLDDIKASLISWLQKFHGVASRYLQNYWDWFSMQINQSSEFEMLQNSLSYCDGCQIYRAL